MVILKDTVGYPTKVLRRIRTDIKENGFAILPEGFEHFIFCENKKEYSGSYRAMTKEQYIAFNIEESEIPLKEAKIKVLNKFFDKVAGEYGFAICTNKNQLISVVDFAAYLGIRIKDSQGNDIQGQVSTISFEDIKDIKVVDASVDVIYQGGEIVGYTILKKNK